MQTLCWLAKARGASQTLRRSDPHQRKLLYAWARPHSLRCHAVCALEHHLASAGTMHRHTHFCPSNNALGFTPTPGGETAGAQPGGLGTWTRVTSAGQHQPLSITIGHTQQKALWSTPLRYSLVFVCYDRRPDTLTPSVCRCAQACIQATRSKQ
jgi:hypothetical protein